MRRLFVIVLTFVFLLTGCSSSNNSAQQLQSQNEQSQNEKIQIGMLFDTFVIERWQRDRDIFVSAAMELGAEVNVQNANGDAEEQVSQMEYFINKGVDVIVVVPIESELLVESIQKAKQAGIKVISYDRLSMQAGVDLYISFDNESVGRLMGEAVSSRVQEGDKVLMLCGPLSDSNVSLVEKGFTEEVAKKNIVIEEIFHAQEWRAENAAAFVENYGDKIKDIDAIMCGNDNLATKVVRVLAEKQLAGKVVVVAQDADLEACQRIVEETQYMTVYKQVDKLAYQAAVAAVALAKGEKPDTEDMIDDGMYQVPYIKLEPVAVTKDNLDEIIIEGGFHNEADVYINRPDLLSR